MSRRSGLGRGLAALIPPAPRPDEQPPPSSPGPDAAPGGAGPRRTESSAATTDAVESDESDESDQLDEGVRLIEAPAPPTSTGDASSTAPQPASDATSEAAAGSTEPAQDAAQRVDEVIDAPSAATDVSPAANDDPAAATSEVERGDASADTRAAPVASAVPSTTATLEEVDLDRIDPNPAQPRDVFDPDELDGLATSLRDVGVLQPLVVRPAEGGRYQLIAGERRWRAAQLAELGRVPVVVRHTDDADLLKEALVENIHRVQLNPLEEAAAYQQLLEEFGVTQEELATRLGKSRPTISNAIRLLGLPPAVQRRVAAGVLSAGHAKVLLALDDAGAQTRLGERIVAEGLSVRATEELVRLRLLDEPAPPARSRKAPTAPGLIELQEDLSDALEARVRISMGTRKGKVSIEFASVDDLERIVGVIAGGISQSRRPAHAPDEPGDDADGHRSEG